MDAREGGPDPVRRGLQKALGEQYAVLRALGKGGMGSVYLARDVALERLVAVKVLPLEREGDAASRERFRREARTAARLTHPNIVPLHTFGEAEGMMYLVMGYVQGEPLSSRMRPGVPFELAAARRVGAEIADALDHAHRRGVVHRDVKPQNILLEDESGRALLADFGIAKARGVGPSVTQAGGVIGTPAYMSPEQAAGRDELDGRSDLYSLGVVLYTLLAGRPPIHGKDVGDILAKHLTQEPISLKQARPDLPDDVAAAVMRCLAKDPEARWPDARRLREALAPTGLDEEQLPEPLDGLDGMAPGLLPIALVWLLAAWHWWVASAAGQEPNVVGALLALVLGGVLVYQLPWLSSAVVLARRRGFSWSTIAGALLRQPSWWRLFWYPPAWRRPWDVWRRLPRPFRVFRVGLTLFAASAFAALPVVMLLMSRIELAARSQRELPPLPASLPVLLAVGTASMLLALAALPFGARHVLELGYDIYTRRLVASALLSGPTVQRSLWRKPEVARALLPAPLAREEAAPEPRLPGDYVSAIVGAGGAAAEAEDLVVQIESLDAEVERLAADLDVEEAAQSRARLAALGAESPADSPERRQRRRLLEEQVDLAAQVEARLRELQSRRDERVEMLRSLWRAAIASTGRADTATRTAPG